MRSLVVGASLMVASSATSAAFFIKFEDCTFSVARLGTGGGLATIQGKPYTLMCGRAGVQVYCSFELTADLSENDAKGQAYQVVLESGPLLHLTTDTGSEYIAIHTESNTAALVSRALHPKYAGAKVCHGFYFDRDQLDK